MEFRVLGPVEARRNGKPLAVGGPKQRALLAIFLLNANQVVSRDRLLDALWGDRLPASSSHTLDDYISRLRRTLGDGRLTRHPPGYLLKVEPGELDLDVFRQLADAGEVALREQRTADASDLFEQALQVWEGVPLGHAARNGALDAELDRLEELRFAAIERRIDCDLAMGRHARAIPELQALVEACPLRETFRAQLMLALYRAGRQVDALAVYVETRAMWVEELGLEPDARLRMLQQRILVQDPMLQHDAAQEAGPDRPPTVRTGVRGRVWSLVAAGVLVVLAGALVVIAFGARPKARLAVAPSVAFVDVRSGRLVRDVPVPAPGAGELRVGGGWLWDKRGPGVLFQIDPYSNRVVQSFPIGPTIAGFAIGDGALWFVASDSRTLLRFDPRYGLVTRRIRLSPELEPNLGAISDAADVKVADGSVWVAHGLAQVDRVDPASGRIVHRFPIRDASAIAVGPDGMVWVASADLGLLSKIDPSTDAIVATAYIRPWVCCIAVGGGAVWASNNERIWKLSPDGELLNTIKLASGTGELAFGDGAVWNTSFTLGTLTRVDAQTDATREFRLGHILSGVTTSGDLVAVDVSPTDSDQVAALKGRVLRVRLSQDWIDDPDPAVGGLPGANEWPWLQQLLDATTARLLTYPNAPAPAGWQLVPEIAWALPTVSRDGRTYTFQIRHGFRFSPPSNQSVTAQTFKYTIERALSPVLADNAPAVAVASDIEGVAAYRARKARHVSGIRVHGRTLSITLLRRAPDFPERIALTYFAPVPIGTPAVLNGLRDPIPSAGPYYTALNDGGPLAIVRRNPNYHGPRPQRLDAIVFNSYPDLARDVTAIETGEADYIAEPELPIANAKRDRSPLLGIDELAFNARRGPFANARLRRAASLALNRRALAAVLGDRVTDRYLPIGIPGYTARHVYSLHRPEVARARSLLRSFTGTVTLDVCSDPACSEVGRMVAADLARVGIRTRLRLYGGGLASLTARRGADVVLARVFTPYPDPVAALRAALGRLDANELTRLARLDRPERIAAAVQFELHLLRTSAPAAAFGTPTIPEIFSARVGCKTFQPLSFGVDLGRLCLR